MTVPARPPAGATTSFPSPPGDASVVRRVIWPGPRPLLKSRNSFQARATAPRSASPIRRRSTVRTKALAALVGLLAALVALPAAAETVKIGFLTPRSGPQGAIGEHMKNSVELALDHLGRKLGGHDVEVIYGDEQVKPDVGKQLREHIVHEP